VTGMLIPGNSTELRIGRIGRLLDMMSDVAMHHPRRNLPECCRKPR
jgi:hypothetical protein